MALDAERAKFLASIPRDPKTGQIDFPAAKAKGYTDRDMIEADLEKRRVDAEQAPSDRIRSQVIREALQMKADFKAGKGPYVGQGAGSQAAPKSGRDADQYAPAGGYEAKKEEPKSGRDAYEYNPVTERYTAKGSTEVAPSVIPEGATSGRDSFVYDAMKKLYTAIPMESPAVPPKPAAPAEEPKQVAPPPPKAAPVNLAQADKTNKGAGPGIEYGQPAQGLAPQPRANAPIVQQSIQGNGNEPPPVTGEAPAAKDMRGISGSDLLSLLGQLGLGVTDIAQAHYAGKAGITDPSKLAYRMRAEDEAARQAQEAERAFQERLLGTQAGYAKEAQERELAGKKDVATFEAEIQAARDERIMAMEERVAERASKMEADLKQALQDDDQAFELTKLMTLQDYERESAMEAQERQKELMAIGLSNDIALAQAQAEHERRLAELRAALEGDGKKIGLTAGGLPDLAAAYGIPSVKPLTASK